MTWRTGLPLRSKQARGWGDGPSVLLMQLFVAVRPWCIYWLALIMMLILVCIGWYQPWCFVCLGGCWFPHCPAAGKPVACHDKFGASWQPAVTSSQSASDWRDVRFDTSPVDSQQLLGWQSTVRGLLVLRDVALGACCLLCLRLWIVSGLNR